MAQGLKELFGTNATQEDGVIQITLDDFIWNIEYFNFLIKQYFDLESEDFTFVSS